MKIKKIVIVGGGSAGWMSASYLCKTFPNKEIIVIESEEIATVGVGESTLQDITKFRDYLGIDDKDLVQATNASYKMSIKFTDFYEKDYGSFHYPFRFPELANTNKGLEDWLVIKAFYPETPTEDFVRSFFPHSYLFENNKFSENEYGEFGNYNKQTDVAYHFDASLFGKYLKDSYCIPRGVQHLKSKVTDIVVSENGIDFLVLENKDQVFADLFIDCTGFQSLLLGGALKEEFDSYEDVLPNNRAVATRIPYVDKEKELQPFTNCTAIENGWCWNIPLWSRLGSGYVYSDKYVSPEKALDEFKEYLMSKKMVIPRTKEQINNLEFKDIKMRVGIHKRTWVKNVVALGLSAGFIEPLESNGLFSVQWFLKDLCKCLLREKVTQWDCDVYNTTVRYRFMNFLEFVVLHYALSIRDDTSYWKNISLKTFDKNMINLQPTTRVGFADLAARKMMSHTVDPKAGITYISVGMNYAALDGIDYVYDTHNYSLGNVKEYVDDRVLFFNKRKDSWQNAALDAPSLYEYLRDNIHDTKENKQ